MTFPPSPGARHNLNVRCVVPAGQRWGLRTCATVEFVLLSGTCARGVCAFAGLVLPGSSMASTRTLTLSLSVQLHTRLRVAAAHRGWSVQRYGAMILRLAADREPPPEVSTPEDSERRSFTINEDVFGRLQALGATTRPVRSAADIARACLARDVPDLVPGVPWEEKLEER